MNQVYGKKNFIQFLHFKYKNYVNGDSVILHDIVYFALSN